MSGGHFWFEHSTGESFWIKSKTQNFPENTQFHRAFKVKKILYVRNIIKHTTWKACSFYDTAKRKNFSHVGLPRFAFTLKQTISKLLFIFANIIFTLIKLHEKNATEMNFFFKYRKTCSNKREAFFSICTRLKCRQSVRMINTVYIRGQNSQAQQWSVDIT